MLRRVPPTSWPCTSPRWRRRRCLGPRRRGFLNQSQSRSTSCTSGRSRTDTERYVPPWLLGSDQSKASQRRAPRLSRGSCALSRSSVWMDSRMTVAWSRRVSEHPFDVRAYQRSSASSAARRFSSRSGRCGPCTWGQGIVGTENRSKRRRPSATCRAPSPAAAHRRSRSQSSSVRRFWSWLLRLLKGRTVSHHCSNARANQQPVGWPLGLLVFVPAAQRSRSTATSASAVAPLAVL